MWCIVSLPDGKTLAVDCDPKAIGRDCLEKLCEDLQIICEDDYFGLRNKEDNLWINLRNRLADNRLDRSEPILLSLGVKFWVPPHLVLQETARQIFYMQARSDLLEGRLQPADWKQSVELSAFLVHADTVRYQSSSNCPATINCTTTVTPPPPTTTTTTTTMLTSSTGRLIRKRERSRECKKRKLSKDKNVDDECVVNNGNSNNDVFNNNNQNNETINRIDISNGSTTSATTTTTPSSLKIYQNYIIRPDGFGQDEKIPQDILENIAKEHSKLVILKMSSNTAKYWLLEKISKLRGFGYEKFTGISTLTNTPCTVAIGPHGLTIDIDDDSIGIPFAAIKTATPKNNVFKLNYINQDHKDDEFELRLQCPKMTKALYRAITEKHAFYSCETVRPVVTHQIHRNFKGTIASMFMGTTVGISYIFDIERTCRETHDYARRVLHARGIDIAATNELLASLSQIDVTSDFDVNEYKQNATFTNENIKKEVSKRLLEIFTCRICMDKQIDATLLPCGHVTSCQDCGKKCEKCPLCRVVIQSVQKIFLPTEIKPNVITTT